MTSSSSSFTSPTQNVAMAAGPIVALLAGYLMYAAGLPTDAAVTLGITALCVIWWVFEPIPIPATSLLPLALLPLMGVLTPAHIASAYGHSLILLLLGGFILSTALAKNGAHRRIALTMVRAFGGTSSRRLVFGFMAASAVLSMWISNTATTLMLLPVALAVLEKSDDADLARPLLLGIAYAASVGGIGTPIGTPPNVIFMGVYEQQVGERVTFAGWMAWGVPVVLVLLPLIGVYLTRKLRHHAAPAVPEVGPWRPAEVRVLMVFAATALLWITRQEPFGGWAGALGIANSQDYMVAFLAVAALFLIPDGKGERLLDWDTAAQIPWGMLILFGAGIAIAEAFTQSGLSETIGALLSGVASLHVLLIMLCISLAVTFLTETTSNTATTTLLMPILAAGAMGAGMDPKLFMVPAAMSASCAFMLPVATAPNVIMYSTGKFSIEEMAREGFALNFIGALVISTLCYLLIA
jgi:sodium-dependent dicarboxylate transporter 2/3/5